MDYSAKFSEDGNSLKVILKGEGGGKLFTVKIDNGEYDTENCTVLINFQKSGKVTDIGLTLAHEISHAILIIYKKYRHISMPDQEKIIYGAQYSYMTAFRYLGVEYSKKYSDHVFRIRSYYKGGTSCSYLSNLEEMAPPHKSYYLLRKSEIKGDLI